MLKYKNNGSSITIELTKEYSIVAMYKSTKDDEKINLSLYLSCNGINDLRHIGTESIASSWKDARQNICGIIDDMIKSGDIKKYIETYEYEFKCIDKGIEFFDECKHGKN